MVEVYNLYVLQYISPLPLPSVHRLAPRASNSLYVLEPSSPQIMSIPPDTSRYTNQSTSLKDGSLSSFVPIYWSYFPAALSLLIFQQYKTLPRILSVPVSVHIREGRERCLQEPAGDQEPENNRVTLVVLRPLGLWVDEHRDEAAAVGDGELEGAGRGPLVMARRVVRQPSEDRGHRAVQPSRHQKRHAVLDAYVYHISYNGIPDDGQGKRAEHHDATNAQTVRQKGDDDYRITSAAEISSRVRRSNTHPCIWQQRRTE